MTIKAVLFDMGNTLVKYDVGSPEQVFQRVLGSVGVSRSSDDIKKAFLNAEKEAKYMHACRRIQTREERDTTRPSNTLEML